MYHNNFHLYFMLIAWSINLSLGSCQRKTSQQNSLEKNYQREKEKAIKSKPSTLNSKAILVDLGFYDKPIFYWMEYDGLADGKRLQHLFKDERKTMINQTVTFPDIHLATIYNEKGELYYQGAYQVIDSTKDKKLFKEREPFQLWWGTSNLRIRGKKGTTYFCMGILNIDPPFQAYERNFQQVPGVSKIREKRLLDKDSCRVHGEIYNISIVKLSNEEYDVMLFKPATKPWQKKYKLNRPLTNPNLRIFRYYDPDNGKIYLLEPNTWLEPVE